MPRFETPDQRIRRLSQELLRSQTRSEKIRNKTAKHDLERQFARQQREDERFRPRERDFRLEREMAVRGRHSLPPPAPLPTDPDAGPLGRLLGEGVSQANQRVFEPGELVGGRAVDIAARGTPLGAPGLAARLLGQDRIAEQLPGRGRMPDPTEARFLPGDVRAAGESIVGGEEEQRRVQERLEPLGLGNRLVGGAILDPTNLVPGVGLVPPGTYSRLGERAGASLAERGGVRALPGRMLAEEAGQIRFGAEQRGTQRIGSRPYHLGAEEPTPEGMRLTARAFPTSGELRVADQANMDAINAFQGQKYVKRKGAKGGQIPTAKFRPLVEEAERIQAQAEIMRIIRSGRSVTEQFNEIADEARLMDEEIFARSEANATQSLGSGRSRMPEFGKDFEIAMGERSHKANFAKSRAFERRPNYPDLDDSELRIRLRTFQDFIDNHQYVPQQQTVAQGTLGGGRQELFATEAERGGIRAQQGQLGIGAGERPIETAGPLFAEPAGGTRRTVRGPRREGEVRIGDESTLMGRETQIVDTQIIDGVRYELHQAKKGRDNSAGIRVFDEDSGNLVSAKTHPDYDAAAAEYADTIRRVGGESRGTFASRGGTRIPQEPPAAAEEAAPPPPPAPPEEPPRFGPGRGEPPREPPQEPPTGGVPPDEPPWEDVRDRALTALKQSKPITAAQATELSLERSRRVKAYSDMVADLRKQGLSPREAERTARRELAGEVEKVPGLKLDLSEPDVNALFRRINDFDYGTEPFLRVRASVAMEKLVTETPLQANEIDVLRRVFGDEFAEALEKAAKGGKKGWDDLFDIIVLPKTVLSSFDLSYPFRQGIKTALRHPLEFFGNIPNMAKSFASQRIATHIDETIKNDPTRILVNADGKTTEMSLGAINQNIDILRPMATGQRNAAEEGFLSQLGLKLPGVKQSSRAFVTYGNKLRADLAKYWIGHWQKTGVDITPERLESLGNLLNRLTGRGTLGKGPGASQVTRLLQAAWWSPQYRLSGPQSYAQLFNRDPEIRKIAAQNLAAYVGGGVGILGMLSLLPNIEVEVDPRATDFGKIKAGNFRVNFWGTDQLLARSIAMATTRQKIDPGLGTPQPIRPGDVAIDYFRSGLAPEWSLTWDALTGENYIGEEFKMDADEALDRLAPIALQDTINAYQEGGPLAASVTAPLSTLGLSADVYPESVSNQLQAIGQYRNIDPNLENELQKRGGFYDRVDVYRKKLLEETGVKPSTSMGILVTAREEGRDADFIRAALNLRSGSKTEVALRNPAWLKYIADNYDRVLNERPDLVDPEQGAPDYIIRYLRLRKVSGE